MFSSSKQKQPARDTIRDVHHAVRQLVVLLKVCGLCPFSDSPLVQTLLFIFSIFIAVFNISVSITASICLRNINSEWYETNLYFYLDQATLLLTCLCYIVTVVTCIINRHKLINEFTQIDEVDQTFLGMGYKFMYVTLNQHWVTAVLIVPIPIVFCLDFNYFSAIEFLETWLQLFSLYVPLIMIHLADAQWYTLVKIVGDHFVLATRILESVLNNPLSGFTSPKVEQLLIIHLKLCKVSNSIGNIYGFHHLICCIYIFVVLTFHVFVIIELIVRKTLDSTVALVLIAVVLLRIEALWIVVSVAERTRAEASQFNFALYKLMSEDKTGQITKNEKLQLHLQMKNSVSFTGYRFFNIGYPIIQGMVSTAVTFLVILLQAVGR